MIGEKVKKLKREEGYYMYLAVKEYSLFCGCELKYLNYAMLSILCHIFPYLQWKKY